MPRYLVPRETVSIVCSVVTPAAVVKESSASLAREQADHFFACLSPSIFPVLCTRPPSPGHSSADKFVTVCFCLLLIGFYLVARQKAQTPIAPAGNPPLRANATAAHPLRLPQWCSDIRELWASWLPNNSQPSARPPRPPSTRRPKSAQSGATSSFASAKVAPSVVEHCRCASYDLDHELTTEMGRISHGQAGHPGEDSSASVGQRGHVEGVPIHSRIQISRCDCISSQPS